MIGDKSVKIGFYIDIFTLYAILIVWFVRQKRKYSPSCSSAIERVRRIMMLLFMKLP